MGILSGLQHLANFVAPAVGVAALLALLSWGLRPGARLSSLAWSHARNLFVWALLGGVLVLLLGLVFFGRDGKMATYGMLVAVMGTLAFWHHQR
jgi:hypothetical protein